MKGGLEQEGEKEERSVLINSVLSAGSYCVAQCLQNHY